MITKLDVYSILFEMRKEGVPGADDSIKLLSRCTEVPVSVIQFVNNVRPLPITEFYEDLRRKCNGNASKLYKNLLKETIEPLELIKAASSYLTQVFIRAERLKEQGQEFMKSSRASQISEALSNYLDNGSIESLVGIMQLIRKDIKILENREA